MLSFMRLRISSTDKTRFGYKKESITSRQPLRLRYLKVYTGAEDNQKKLPVMKRNEINVYYRMILHFI